MDLAAATAVYDRMIYWCRETDCPDLIIAPIIALIVRAIARLEGAILCSTQKRSVALLKTALHQSAPTRNFDNQYLQPTGCLVSPLRKRSCHF